MNEMRVLKALAAVLFAAATAPALSGEPSAERREIVVTLSNYRFTPNVLRLERGVPYTLRLMNTSSGGHSFSAPALFASSMIAAEDSAKIVSGRIEVPGGESLEVTLTPLTPGTYPLTCTHFLHAPFGMRGQVVVE